MRVSRQEKEKTHERIIASATVLFKERGIDNTSLSDLMQASGLTHGGFYRHFKTKEELANAAINAAFDEVITRFDAENNLAGSNPQQTLFLYIERYLSDGHVANPGLGCPVAALGSEIARHQSDEKSRMAFEQGLENLIGLLEKSAPDSVTDKSQWVLRQFAMMLGGVILARTCSEAMREQVLNACRRPWLE